MTDVLNVLTRKTSLRKACKELQLTDMEKLSVMLGELISEREAEEAEMIEQERQRREKVAEIHRKMAEEGINVEDLMADSDSPQAASSGARKKTKVPPKYQIEDGEGKIHYWTGRGRTPKPFKDYLEKGGEKEDLLIR